MNSIVWREFVVHSLIGSSGKSAKLNEAMAGLLQSPTHKEQRYSWFVP
jgi:hypothetical protein